ncbi:MAG: hypothetical protein ACR2PI_11510 [Hyphomicrobiaceae bacterium]
MPLTISGISTPIPTLYKDMVNEKLGGFDLSLKLGICIQWLASIAQEPKGDSHARVVVAFDDFMNMKAQLHADLRQGLDPGPYMRRRGLHPDQPTSGPASCFGAAVGSAAHKEGAALLIVRSELVETYAIGIYRAKKHIVLFAPTAGELAPIKIKYAARDIDSFLDLGRRDKVSSYVGYMVTFMATAKTGPLMDAPPPPPRPARSPSPDNPTGGSNAGATATVTEQEPLYAELERELPVVPYVPPIGTTAQVPRPAILRR